jgi:CO/xanthine dehydrogenase Mo-binding subunit
VPNQANEPVRAPSDGANTLLARVIPDLMIQAEGRKTVGQAEPKKDALKLVKGSPSFTADMEQRGLLHAKLLTSPHAHARIKRLDPRAAEALPGVHAVISYLNVPRVFYASGGQSYPNPKPWDQVSFDHTVRYVGDRVAAVAAETLEIAEKALTLIEVEYEVLPAVFDPEEALQPGAPLVHDEPDAIGIPDPSAIWSHIDALVGDMAKGSPRPTTSSSASIACRAADAHRTACGHHLVGQRRAAQRADGHAGAVSRAAHAGPADRAARQAHPRDQAAHRRRLWRQARNVDRGHRRAPHAGDRPAGTLGVHPRRGVPL